MAVWFARQTANINAANVWNAATDGSGAWLTWPPASGDVLVANSFTLALNVDVNLGASGELRVDTTGGATAGGRFNNTTAGRIVTANVLGATVICVNTTQSMTVIGNITGGTALDGHGVYLNSSGTLTSIGTITGGTASNAYGVATPGTGIIAHTGNCVGNIGRAIHLHSNLAGSTITGNCSGISTYGVFQVNSGTLAITGNCPGGYGVSNTSTGTLTISGYVEASATAPGANNSVQGILEVGETRSASNGRPAVAGAFRYASTTAAKSMPYTASEGQISMTVLDVAAIVPAESDVRKGLIYGDGAYTGTLPLGRNRTSMAGRF